MADRYWIATASAYWNDTANWSTSSGGAGGASVPGASDAAIFDGNGLGSCTLDATVSVTTFTIEDAYTGVFNFSIFDVTASGNISIGSGVILTNVGNRELESTGGSITITGPSSTRTLNPTNTFTLTFSTALSITNYSLGNISASASGTCINCEDLGSNVNLVFEMHVGSSMTMDFTTTSGLKTTYFYPSTVFGSLTGDTLDYTDQSQLLLTVAGTPVDLSDNKWSLGDLEVSYDGKQLTFTQSGADQLASADFGLNNGVILQMNLGSGLKAYFRGLIRRRVHQTNNQADQIQYTAFGEENIANEMDVVDPLGFPGGSLPGFQLTTAEALRRLFLYNTSQLAVMTIPSTIGSPGLDTFRTIVRNDLSVDNLGFTEAVKRVLGEEPSKRVFYNSEDSVWTFPDIAQAQLVEVNISDTDIHPDLQYDIDLVGRYTAIVLYSPFSANVAFDQQKVVQCEQGWQPEFQADWSVDKAVSQEVAALFGSSYSNVFRRWTFSKGSSDGNYQKGMPYRLYVLVEYWGRYRWLPVQSFIDWKNKQVMTKVPIVLAGNPYDPGDSVGPLAAVLTYIDPETVSVSGVDVIRWPPTGYQGTAYTLAGLERTKLLAVDEDRMFTQWAIEKLATLQDIPVRFSLQIKGDPIEEFITLNRRINVVDDNRTTGIENAYGFLLGYRFSFTKPGENILDVTVDRSLLSRVGN